MTLSPKILTAFAVLVAAVCLSAPAAHAASIPVQMAGAVSPAVAGTPPTLVVSVLGSGAVTSKPAGIACPGKCTATFAAGTIVALTAAPKSGGRFLGWGGSCSGAAACAVKVSALESVAVQFSAAAKTTTPPAESKYVAAPGPYRGYYLSFLVSAGGNTILNVNQDTSVSCVGSGTQGDSMQILSVPIKPNGAFSSTTTQQGVFNNLKATFTYTFAGSFHAATATSAAGAAGTYREDVKLASGTTVSCTSGTQPFTATVSQEPPFKKSEIVPGSYRGYYLSFSVAPGGNTILNVSQDTSANCVPSGTESDRLTIGQVQIKPNGSFSSVTSQTTVLNGVSTKLTYTFAGAFEGPTDQGTSTVAGIWREDMVPTTGATTFCTSNDVFWTATLQS